MIPPYTLLISTEFTPFVCVFKTEKKEKTEKKKKDSKKGKREEGKKNRDKGKKKGKKEEKKIFFSSGWRQSITHLQEISGVLTRFPFSERSNFQLRRDQCCKHTYD